MDTLQHGAWGAVAGIATGRSIKETVALAVVGASPDVIGWWRRVFTNKENWDWYTFLHRLEVAGAVGLSGFLSVIATDNPFWAIAGCVYCLHVVMDYPVHQHNRRWWIWNEMFWAEALGWVLILAFLGVWYL